MGQTEVAVAQSWTHAPVVDYDAKSDSASNFWSEVLSGSGDFEILTERARALEFSGSQAQREAALPIWEEAAQLRPEAPEPHYAIGRHHRHLANWKSCSRELLRVFEIDPDYSEALRKDDDSLREQLGTCLLRSEEFEEAIVLFRSLIAQKSESPTVLFRLGEALMALGRLDEAIFSLRQAHDAAAKVDRALERHVGYALAVALDRAERLEESRLLLERLGRRNSQLTGLRSTDKHYAPATEEHYYLALAYGAQNDRLRSLYHFRRFLALVPNSQWRIPAQSHIERTPHPDLAVRLSVSGSAQWQIEALRRAIRTSSRELNLCAAGHPQVLATVTLSGVLSRPPSKHQARAAISAEADVDRETLEQIVQCLESAARLIPMPKQSGLLGGHGSAQFSILGSAK